MVIFSDVTASRPRLNTKSWWRQAAAAPARNNKQPAVSTLGTWLFISPAHTGAVSPASHHGSSICPSVHQCVHWVTGWLTTDKSGIHCCPVLFPDHRTPHLSVQTQLILSAYRRKADGWCSLHCSLVCIIHIQYTAYPYKGVKCEADC